MFVLIVQVRCDGTESELDQQVQAAYDDGCDEGRLDGSVAGTDDGMACQERGELPVDAAHGGMFVYCGDDYPSDEGHPCEWWENGYLECYAEQYDRSYRIGWNGSDCSLDTGT